MKSRIGLYSVLLAAILFVGCAPLEKKDAAPTGNTKSEDLNNAIPAESKRSEDLNNAIPAKSINSEDLNDKKPKPDTQSELSPSAPDPIPAPEIQKTEKPAVTYLITTKNGCNVRSKPNDKSKIITTLKRDQKLKKLDQFENWYNIILPSGKKGWIHKDLVKNTD
jgi:uncharacterized protein YgiM (DUF1202 family)